MAHGPCGEQFKEAFSCFVFSEDEPKGINCVDAFKAMQDCFREHPEVYADEIMDDDDGEPVNPAGEDAPSGGAAAAPTDDAPSGDTTAAHDASTSPNPPTEFVADDLPPKDPPTPSAPIAPTA